MSVPRLRFVHATDLMLGTPLSGVGQVRDDDRDLLLRATLIAFERIVTACVDHEVDFLLLSGNTFAADALPIRAIAALRDGFQTLAEYDVPVFVVSGPCDPPESWEALPPLPESVVHLQLDDGAPVEVTRDGTSIAEIRLLGAQQPAARTLTLRNRLGDLDPASLPAGRLFTIGVVPATSSRQPVSYGDLPSKRHGAEFPFDPLSSADCDYLALGRQPEGGADWSHAMPTSPQALSPLESGPQGCLLVVVDGNGTVQQHRLPTACVRFESAALSIDSKTSQDELVALLSGRVAESQSDPGEELTVFTWNIAGNGSLFDALSTASFHNDLAELCELEVPAPEGTRRLHCFALQPVPDQTDWPADDESPQAVFLRTLETCAPTLAAVREIARAESAQAAERWAADVLSQLAETDEAAVLAHAQAMAIGWLSAVQHSGSRP